MGSRGQGGGGHGFRSETRAGVRRFLGAPGPEGRGPGEVWLSWLWSPDDSPTAVRPWACRGWRLTRRAGERRPPRLDRWGQRTTSLLCPQKAQLPWKPVGQTLRAGRPTPGPHLRPATRSTWQVPSGGCFPEPWRGGQEAPPPGTAQVPAVGSRGRDPVHGQEESMSEALSRVRGPRSCALCPGAEPAPEK